MIESNVRSRLVVAPVLSVAKRVEMARSNSVPTLKKVVDAFLNGYQQNKSPAMFKKHKPVLSMLLAVIGDKPITEIKQADINGFFELLGRLPPRWADECRSRKLTVRELAELDFDITLGPKSLEDKSTCGGTTPYHLRTGTCTASALVELFAINLCTNPQRSQHGLSKS